MAAKDNVRAREGVVLVERCIKAAWIYITSVTRCRKRRRSWEELGLLKESITDRRPWKS